MGCGKSTFLNIAAGLVAADRGRVTVDGEVVSGVRRDTAYVFQNYSLLPWLSAVGNVQLAVAAAVPSWTKSKELDQSPPNLGLDRPGNSIYRRPGQLSGGKRQSLAVPRGIGLEP